MLIGQVQENDGYAHPKVTIIIEANTPVPNSVNGGNASTLEVDAIVDTGFPDFLTLPSALIESLGLKEVSVWETTLNGGQKNAFRAFDAWARIGDESRCVAVLEWENPPLIGMSLVDGYHLAIDVHLGGSVTIKR